MIDPAAVGNGAVKMRAQNRSQPGTKELPLTGSRIRKEIPTNLPGNNRSQGHRIHRGSPRISEKATQGIGESHDQGATRRQKNLQNRINTL